MDVVFDNIAGISDLVAAEVAKAVAITTLDVEARAKENAPVLTGNLRASINSQSQDLTGVVAVGADYGYWVEVGTHKRAATPYLRPAMEAAQEGFIASVQTALNAAAKGAS